MKTLPATYLEVRAEFVRRRKIFRDIAQPLNTSATFVRNTLLTYWGRTDVYPKEGTLSKSIITATEALLSHDPTCPGVSTPEEPCLCETTGEVLVSR